MFQIDNATAVPTLPVVPAQGTPGYFTNGNLQTALQPTHVDDWWLNQIQSEILAVITFAGLIPAKNNTRQLLEALQTLGLGVGQTGYLPLTGGTLAGPGNLAVQGTLNVAGASGFAAVTATSVYVAGADPVTIAAPAGQNGRFRSSVANARVWSMGTVTNGNLRLPTRPPPWRA